jgi:hypothetical protein
MALDAKTLQDKLKGLKSKLPAKAPEDVQKDYADFLKKADFFMTVLNRFATDGPSAKDLTDFNSKKQDLAKLKDELAKLKDKINDAVKEQQSDKNDVIQVLREVLGKNSDIQDDLKNKKDKEATDLARAMFNFAQGVQQASGLEAAAQVTE